MSLISKLTEATQILKEEYIAKTITYAEDFHAEMTFQSKQPETYWLDLYGVKYEMKEMYGKMHPTNRMTQDGVKFYNSSLHPKVTRAQNKARLISGKSVEEFVAKEVAHAEAKYKNDVAKLSKRIEKKGLNQDAITMTSGYVGVNIEITITDGEKTVRAFTIVASGPIQRPHYRYLIK